MTAAAPKAPPSPAWRSRIVGEAEVAPDQLRANPLNFRRHPAAQKRALAGALDEIGFIQRVIVNRTTGNLLDGHARVEIAVERREPTVPVVYVELSIDEERLALATLDPLSAMADTDAVQLQALLEQVTVGDAGVRQLLADLAEQNRVQVSWLTQRHGEADAVPPAPVNPVTQLGDIWALGDHRIICGDCTDAPTRALLLQGEVPDACWTDPPYGVSYVGKTKNALTIENDGAAGLADLLERSFAGMAQDLRPGAAVYVAHPPGALQIVFGNAFSKHFQLRQGLVWDKGTMVLGHSDYHYSHEPILFGYTRGGKGRLGRGGEGWYGDNSQVSVIAVPKPARSEDHPTSKPVELIETCLRNSTDVGHLVFEPFSGSGSTLIACERLGRRCYAIELSPTYVDVAVSRWMQMQFVGKDAVLELTGETFSAIREQRAKALATA